MLRVAVRCFSLFVGLAVAVALSTSPSLGQNAAKQPPNKKAAPKNADPKKNPPKKAEPKKPEPKKTDPKTPDTKTPEPKTTEPEPDLPPTDGPVNPMDLVRGLREHGMADLALEYLHDLERKPLPQAVKELLPLEKARCQLDAADEEPDEGTRQSLINEAKEGFATFLRASPSHPRVTEAFLALARLASLDAKAQLSKARRIDVPSGGTPEEDRARQEAIDRQKAEAVKARPMFQSAASQFQRAAERIQSQLQQPNLEPALRRSLTQAKYDAELARAINQFTLADTYLHATSKETTAKSDILSEAQKLFLDLGTRDGVPTRVSGVARAWAAECYFEKAEIKEGEEQFARIEKSNSPANEDAKRMVRFFKLRRKAIEALGSRTLPDLNEAERQARDWLRMYGPIRRAQAEALAVKWYLAYLLQFRGDAALAASLPKNPPKATTPPKPTTIPATARRYYEEAEKLYRTIAHSDNEYSQRATRQRMIVVRRLLGEADKRPADYHTFEEAQMASLIQTAKLLELQRDRDKNATEIKSREHSIVALLERARELSGPKDSPSDVADVLIRLIYFYQVTGHPQQAAVLGEYVARSIKAPGGKSAAAGIRGLVAYIESASRIRTTDPERLEASRRADRDRAIRLARFLDEKYPNDTATDFARHRLAFLLNDDGKPVEAFETLLKIRPGYDKLASARLLEGAIAYQLLSAKDSPLAPERKRDVFRRVVADLDKLVKPSPDAPEDEVRPYLTDRVRLALLYLLQHRVDPEGEKLEPGYIKSRKVAEDAMQQVMKFPNLTRELGPASHAPNLDGWELRILAEDARTKAVYLEGQALFLAGKFDESYAVIGAVLAEMNQQGPLAEQVKNGGGAVSTAPPKVDPKTPAPKTPTPKTPEPKKEEMKKDAPKPSAPPEAEDAAQKERVVRIAEMVDRYRGNLIVLALKIRVKQGQAEKGAEQLELLKKFGGSIEANVGTLEQITADMAGQILALRRAGQNDEANSLSSGFAKLLAKLSAEPNLPATMQRFLGQSLILVGEYEQAATMLRKVPAADPALMAKPIAELKDDEKRVVLEYRRATLELVRALRQGGKLDDAGGVLGAAMGTPEKPGWAANSVDFRKEVAYLHEARGTAAEGNIKVAKEEWGKALKEWSTIFAIYRNAVSKGPPKGPNGMEDNQAFLRTKNTFFEAFFNVQRCLLKANLQLLKGNPKLQKTFDDIGKRFADLEKSSGGEITQEVREQFHDLLKEIPELKKSYEAAGGKLFLTAPEAIATQ